LENGATYYYQVEAENEAGTGLVSIVVHATPMGLPGIVEFLIVEQVTDGIRLIWDNLTDGGGAASLTYKILRDTTNDPRDVIKVLTDDNTFVDTRVTLGTLYFYRVLVVNPVGDGPLMDPVSVMAAAKPEKVTDVRAAVGNNSVSLTWTAPDDMYSPIKLYIITRGIFETGMSEIGRVNGTVLNYTDRTVGNGRTYLYSVHARNEVGNGAPSDPVTATPLGAPGPPGVLEAKAKGKVIVLTWTSPTVGDTAPVTDYKVYRGPSELELELLEEVGDVLTYTDADVKAGKAYYYKVVATSDSGDSEMSRPAKARVKEPEDGPGFSTTAIIVAVGLMALFAGFQRDPRR
jgi:titin